jgi:hypothetical protein
MFKSSAIGGIAGKYMLAVIGETKLAAVTKARIHLFVFFEKTLYAGPLETLLMLSGSPIMVSSA